MKCLHGLTEMPLFAFEKEKKHKLKCTYKYSVGKRDKRFLGVLVLNEGRCNCSCLWQLHPHGLRDMENTTLRVPLLEERKQKCLKFRLILYNQLFWFSARHYQYATVCLQLQIANVLCDCISYKVYIYFYLQVFSTSNESYWLTYNLMPYYLTFGTKYKLFLKRSWET